MRIRQIKPSWFTDRLLQTGLQATTREFYIGLWMLADDDGWFEWDPDAIGVALYGFLPLLRRDALTLRHATALEALTPDSPHLVLHPCGHAQVPKMPQHQRVSDTKRVVSDHRRHQSGRCPHLPAGTRGAPLPAAPVMELERGTERNGTGSARASATEETTEFRARVPEPHR